jgi:hypothetical protein
MKNSIWKLLRLITSPFILCSHRWRSLPSTPAQRGLSLSEINWGIIWHSYISKTKSTCSRWTLEAQRGELWPMARPYMLDTPRRALLPSNVWFHQFLFHHLALTYNRLYVPLRSFFVMDIEIYTKQIRGYMALAGWEFGVGNRCRPDRVIGLAAHILCVSRPNSFS